MLNICCNTDKYEYDIRALVMAFYPYEKLVYSAEGDVNDSSAICITMNSEKISVCLDKTARITEFTDKIDSTAYRNALKRTLYEVLSEHTGRVLKWGTLTGVRPSKLPMKKLIDGSSKQDAVSFMVKEYYCSDEKAELSADVAEAELKLLKQTDYKNGYSIYIGIPFCPTICTYCSFSSMSLAGMVDVDEMMESYINALEKECKSVKNIYPNKKLTSIYIGGGTPTALTEKYLKKLMDIVCDNFPVNDVFEFTVEAGRPDSINIEKLRILKEAGVTRISVNPQTMKEETLKNIGRRHTVKQTQDAFYLARMAGFNNINMDLIAGLSGEDEEDFSNTLFEVQKLAPDSFTVHSLVIKRASEYRQQREFGPEAKVSVYSNVVENMLSTAAVHAKSNGYKPYYMYRQKNKAGLSDNPVLENVGYSQPDKEGIYNVLIMEEKQTIIALGAGASSKILTTINNQLGECTHKIVRVANVKNVREYITRIDEMIKRKKRWFDEC